MGWHNYIWAIKDPDFRRSIVNNLGWLLIVPTLSTFFGLVIANLAIGFGGAQSLNQLFLCLWQYHLLVQE